MTKEYKFKVGQKVKVVNNEERYSFYNDWANVHDFELANHKTSVREGAEGTVIAVGLHLVQDDIVLYGVKIGDENHIFNNKGLIAAEEFNTIRFNVELENLEELRGLLLEIETIKNRIFK
jgi:hypothetical protein